MLGPASLATIWSGFSTLRGVADFVRQPRELELSIRRTSERVTRPRTVPCWAPANACYGPAMLDSPPTEPRPKPILEIAERLGLTSDQLLLYGRDKAKIDLSVMKSPRKRPNPPRLILV